MNIGNNVKVIAVSGKFSKYLSRPGREANLLKSTATTASFTSRRPGEPFTTTATTTGLSLMTYGRFTTDPARRNARKGGKRDELEKASNAPRRSNSG